MTDLRKAAQDVVDVWRMYGTAKSLRGWMEILEAALKEQQAQPVARSTGWAAKRDHYNVPVLFNPYTGEPRDVRDVQSDPQGILIVPPGAQIVAVPPPAPVAQQEPVLVVEREPVAWRTFDGEGNYDFRDYDMNENYREKYIKHNGERYASWVDPLYTTPPQRQPLTDEEVLDTVRDCGLDWHRGYDLDERNRYEMLARAIERAHGITKESGE